MNPKFREKWTPFEPLMAFDAISAKFSLPTDLVTEPIEHLLPSIELGTDGPILKSVFLVTKTYLCEVRISGVADDFDFTLLEGVADYRVSFGRIEVTKKPTGAPLAPAATENVPIPDEKIVYETAKVTLAHSLTIGLTSELHFAGTNRDNWFQLVRIALPISLLERSRG